MLRQLRSRLHAANFNVHFAIVTAEASDDDTLVELSRAAGTIPLVEFETLPEAFGVRSGWNRYSNDIMVVDSCGRMTYQVVMPWSSLQYPYVKAAILSTIIDHPCGPCNGTQGKSKPANSHALNATLHEMKESRAKSQSKLVSIINQYKPQSKEVAEKNENVRETVQDVSETTDSVMETIANDTDASAIKNEQTVVTENPSSTTLESDNEKTHTLIEESVPTTERTEKKKSKGKGKGKGKGKKHRSKTTTESPKVEPISDDSEQLRASSMSDFDLDRDAYSSVENAVSAEVTLAPLRETEGGVIPIRVIMRSPHEHEGKNYEYLEMQLGNPGYHGHLDRHDKENELEQETKELQMVEDDFDAIGVEDEMLDEEETENKAVNIGDEDIVISDGEEKVEIEAERLDSGNEGKDLTGESTVKGQIHSGKDKERKEKDEHVSDKKVKEETKDTTLNSDIADKKVGKDTKKKNKETEKGNKKKGSKTKQTSIPEEDWMTAVSKDVPDKFDDIYPPENDFAKDINEEESNHNNGELDLDLDDISVSDLKYLIDHMGLEAQGAMKTAQNDTRDSVVETTTENVPLSTVQVEEDSELMSNKTEKATNGEKEHHKSVNAISTDKIHKDKTLTKKKQSAIMEKELFEEEDDSAEIVEKKKVTLAPTLSESNSESISASDGNSKEVMEHYSKLLPWINYRL